MFSQAIYDTTFGSAWHVKGAEIAKLLVYVTYAGDPSSNLTPAFIGQSCFDTTNSVFYHACGLTATDWKKSTN